MKFTRRKFLKAGAVALVATQLPVFAKKSKPPLRFSTWYWLNSINRDHWDEDFATISKTGFTDVILCWGLDSAAILAQSKNTKIALDLCQRHGLKAYLLIWHPVHNSLPRRDEFQQADNQGNRLFTFNLFHREWRRTQWKNYLQGVAALYKNHPALAGYLFDDTFGIGPVGGVAGDKTKTRGKFVSYSPYDIAEFQTGLRKKYHSLARLNKSWNTSLQNWSDIKPPQNKSADHEVAWNDWCALRLQWLREWADDTVNFIRAVDPSLAHEIYLEDGAYVLGPTAGVKATTNMRDTLGLDFATASKKFDAIGAYPAFQWEAADALEVALQSTRRIVHALQGCANGRQKVVYTFWAANTAINRPPTNFPTGEQIISIAKASLDMGIRHLDFYGFRIGDWRVDQNQWEELRPKADENYPLVKRLTGYFLCDRPEILTQLKKFFAEVS